MASVRDLYDRTDSWLRGLSRGPYAVFFGLAGGVGVLVAGLAVSGDLLVVQAVAMALVLCGLEWVFGLHQTTEE